MAEEAEVAPDQATNQVWGGERSSRARIWGSGVERVDWRVWMSERGRETKQESMPPTTFTSNSIRSNAIRQIPLNCSPKHTYYSLYHSSAAKLCTRSLRYFIIL